MRCALCHQQRNIEISSECVIGRGDGCQLWLDDPLVSRRHAKVRVEGDAVVLEDLGSRNGVSVNGARIAEPRRLEHGDRILIGGQELTVLIHYDFSADTLVRQPDGVQDPFGIFGALADKALGLGHGEEAERLIAASLEHVLLDLRARRPVSGLVIERAVGAALKIAAATGSPRWVDYVFNVYTELGRACPTAVVDELYTVLHKVRHPNPSSLLCYLEVLRRIELGPSERFLRNRLEGLEGLIRAR